MQISLPDSLQWLRGSDEGRAWLDSLPALLARACERWSLSVGDAYAGSHVSLVLPALRGSEPLVLKLQYPDRESEHEAAALAAWDGRGAVRLIDYAPDLQALLLERCIPGTRIADAGADVALHVLADLVQRLAVAEPGPFTTLAHEAQHWAEHMIPRWEASGRPFERVLVERAVDLLEDLARSQGEQVLVHQDLHAHNVLAAQREPWLAIDPKPLRGELAFALAPIVRSRELGHSREAVMYRLDYLSDATGVDRSRARDWCLTQTVAWSVDDRSVFQHPNLETARWLLRA